jgi:hypothetical protein
MTKTQEQQDGLALIALKLRSADKLIEECKDIAEELNVQFDIEFGGYGTGATYIPDAQRHEWTFNTNVADTGWSASSQNC